MSRKNRLDREETCECFFPLLVTDLPSSLVMWYRLSRGSFRMVVWMSPNRPAASPRLSNRLRDIEVWGKSPKTKLKRFKNLFRTGLKRLLRREDEYLSRRLKL